MVGVGVWLWRKLRAVRTNRDEQRSRDGLYGSVRDVATCMATGSGGAGIDGGCTGADGGGATVFGKVLLPLSGMPFVTTGW